MDRIGTKRTHVGEGGETVEGQRLERTAWSIGVGGPQELLLDEGLDVGVLANAPGGATDGGYGETMCFAEGFWFKVIWTNGGSVNRSIDIVSKVPYKGSTEYIGNRMFMMVWNGD